MARVEREAGAHSVPARVWRWGLAAGAAAAAMDVGLIAAVEPAATIWVLLQVALFWLPAGWLVVSGRSGLPAWPHALALTLILDAPWAIAESVGRGAPDHLGPMLAQGVVFGLLFGWARRRAWA